MLSHRILIIDDEPLIRRAFLLAGAARNHKMKAASTGKGAIDLWLSYNPDLVFLDALLPDMSGFRILKNLPENVRAKCVMISANANFENQIADNKKIQLFVKKPFENIFQVIERGERLIPSEDASLSISPTVLERCQSPTKMKDAKGEFFCPPK